ncbi:MAG TPA: carbohydrate porin [Succinivibrionaceae bacterium]|nr:carbohydrate porin [Succinivibrionaceae bacterium]
MKKVNLLAAAVLAAAFAMPAQADFTPNANFNGYMRSGVMHGNSAFGSKTDTVKLGRLGNENDTFMEFGLGADVAKVDDVTYSVYGMIAHGGDGNETDWNTNLSCRQAWAGAKNLLGQGDDFLWIGKRYYKREDIHILDEYYYNVSGTGVGLENVVLGPGKISLAWTRNDKDAKKDKVNIYSMKSEYKYKGLKDDGNKPAKVKVNTYDVRYEFPVWDGASLQLGSTYLEAEKDKNGSYRTYTIEKENSIGDGLNLSAELNIGLLGGFNKTVVQSFSGSSAADVHYGTGSSVYYDEGQGWRLINWGDVHFTKEFGMFHVVQYAHSSGFKSYDSERSVNLVVRPYYQLTKMTKLLAEVGWFADKKTANTDDKGVQSYVSKHGSKYTLAYAISPDASNFWSRPEFRFYVSHVSVSDNMNIGPTNEWVRQTSDNMFGAQVEAWW